MRTTNLNNQCEQAKWPTSSNNQIEQLIRTMKSNNEFKQSVRTANSNDYCWWPLVSVVVILGDVGEWNAWRIWLAYAEEIGWSWMVSWTTNPGSVRYVSWSCLPWSANLSACTFHFSCGINCFSVSSWWPLTWRHFVPICCASILVGSRRYHSGR